MKTRKIAETLGIMLGWLLLFMMGTLFIGVSLWAIQWIGRLI
jgi:hypothetical protein